MDRSPSPAQSHVPGQAPRPIETRIKRLDDDTNATAPCGNA